jgi:hypothetical protein
MYKVLAAIALLFLSGPFHRAQNYPLREVVDVDMSYPVLVGEENHGQLLSIDSSSGSLTAYLDPAGTVPEGTDVVIYNREGKGAVRVEARDGTVGGKRFITLRRSGDSLHIVSDGGNGGTGPGNWIAFTSRAGIR